MKDLLSQTRPFKFLTGLLCAAAWLWPLPASGTGEADSPVSAAGYVVYDGNPVLEPAPDAWGGSWVLHPGAVVYHDGAFHMFYNAGTTSETHPPYAIGYATSGDGRHWERPVEGPVLTTDDVPFANFGLAANGAFVQDGIWVLYFSAPKKAGALFAGVVGRATAPGPSGPWSVDPHPVLHPGPEGTWDSWSVGHASVIREDDGFAMYYAGKGRYPEGAFSVERTAIGRATSSEGITWEKHDDPATVEPLYAESDPVFVADKNEGAWDNVNIIDPNVQRADDDWEMIYRGAVGEDGGNIGIARSEDGIHWTRHPDNPILKGPTVGKKEIYHSAFVMGDDAVYLYFEAGHYPSSIYLAVRERPKAWYRTPWRLLKDLF